MSTNQRWGFLQKSSKNFIADGAGKCDEFRASTVKEGRTSHRSLFSTPIPPEEPYRPARIWADTSAGGHHAARKEKQKCMWWKGPSVKGIKDTFRNTVPSVGR